MLRSSFTWRLGLLASALGFGACLQLEEQAPRGGGTDGGAEDTLTKQDTAAPPITLVPTSRPALDDFLVQGKYLAFASESRLHQSEGTHFGLVRTFINPLLYNSLAANNREHPQGAAAVKELYKGGQQLAGWAVMVKVASQGNAGDGYFWFEAIDGRVVAQGTGVPQCAQCHEVGQDLILTGFPLR